jgi:hypothetical protein
MLLLCHAVVLVWCLLLLCAHARVVLLRLPGGGGRAPAVVESFATAETADAATPTAATPTTATPTAATPTAATPTAATSTATPFDMSTMVKGLQKMPTVTSSMRTVRQVDALRVNLEPMLYLMNPKPTDRPDVVGVLWSGGLASTFRICELILVHKRVVRPIYMAQAGLDYRKCSVHERVTVRELSKYMRTTRPKQMASGLLDTELYEDSVVATKSAATADNKQIREHLAFVFDVPLHRVAPFYVALVQLRGARNANHTHLSTRHIEIVLPQDGPHHYLRHAVDKWGSAVVATATATATAESNISTCLHTVSAPPATATTTTTEPDPTDRRRHEQFAKLFGHIRFLLPCRTPSQTRALARKHAFEAILTRTWSCREPVYTKDQQAATAAQKRRNNVLHSSQPMGVCGKCESCTQRLADGFARVG